MLHSHMGQFHSTPNSERMNDHLNSTDLPLLPTAQMFPADHRIPMLLAL